VTENRSSRVEQGGRRHPAPAASVVGGFTLLALAFLLLALPLLSLAAAPRKPKLPRMPRGPAEVTKILAQGPHAGTCEACHTEHAGGQPIPYAKALIGPDDNTLCDGCHNVPWQGGSYGDTWLYAGSAHGASPTAIWPGPDPPARTEVGAAGKCLNCHDPHGLSDGTGLIPFLAHQREESLCFTCHDGSPAVTNIRGDVLKAFSHATATYTGRHAGPTESQPSDFAVSPINRRHAECEDCHNPHVARADGPLPPSAPEASKRLLGASRVDVLNGAAGTAPAYTFIPGSDTLTSPVTEYQLCFKCHSSWTTQPSGQTDLARVLNPANPSTHPVEAQGANTNIDIAAFTAGWSATSLTTCGDCHGSDLGAAGPHGSTYQHILRQPYTASPALRTMDPSELCFRCHDYNVYGNSSSGDPTQANSRFNKPNVGKGHADHVGALEVTCYSCHTTHGSATRKHLIVTGRNPGITSYTETPAGGSCTPTCHGTETYTVNYAR
jgi:predicted CXXCH cytochrome family protein